MHVEPANVSDLEEIVVLVRRGAELAKADQSIVVERNNDVTAASRAPLEGGAPVNGRCWPAGLEPHRGNEVAIGVLVGREIDVAQLTRIDRHGGAGGDHAAGAPADLSGARELRNEQGKNAERKDGGEDEPVLETSLGRQRSVLDAPEVPRACTPPPQPTATPHAAFPDRRLFHTGSRLRPRKPAHSRSTSRDSARFVGNDQSGSGSVTKRRA